MLDDLAGKRTGERIHILRERRGLSRPVLAGLVGMSASWLKGIERGTRLPPRLPLLVKLAEALAVGDVAVLAGIDLDLGGAASVPVASFARIPHDAVPAIREAVRDPLLIVPASPADVAALAARTADAWLLWHQSAQHPYRRGPHLAPAGHRRPDRGPHGPGPGPAGRQRGAGRRVRAGAARGGLGE